MFCLLFMACLLCGMSVIGRFHGNNFEKQLRKSALNKMLCEKAHKSFKEQLFCYLTLPFVVYLGLEFIYPHTYVNANFKLTRTFCNQHKICSLHDIQAGESENLIMLFQKMV